MVGRRLCFDGERGRKEQVIKRGEQGVAPPGGGILIFRRVRIRWFLGDGRPGRRVPAGR